MVAMNLPPHLPHHRRHQKSIADRRNPHAPAFTLIELDPREIIDGLQLGQAYAAEDAPHSGSLRETCPYCPGVPLQLVLRFRHVKRSHVFCSNCTRCYDALYPDGTSALAVNLPSVADTIPF